MIQRLLFLTLLTLFKESLQNQSAVVLLISRRVNQRDRTILSFALEQLDQLVFVLEFVLITSAKLIPLLRIMPKPASQFSARRDILQPQIYFGFHLCQAARPQAFNQYALAIILRRFLVSPFQIDHSCSPSFSLLLRRLRAKRLLQKFQSVFLCFL